MNVVVYTIELWKRGGGIAVDAASCPRGAPRGTPMFGFLTFDNTAQMGCVTPSGCDLSNESSNNSGCRWDRNGRLHGGIALSQAPCSLVEQ